MDLFSQVNEAAHKHGLFPALVWGIVQVESGGNPRAWNPEPSYRWSWNYGKGEPMRLLTKAEIESSFPPAGFTAPRGVPVDAEWWGQRASWGLMQVMGAVAREAGFTGLFFTELCDPATGLDMGCRILSRLMLEYGGQAHLAVSAYNAGSARMDAETGRLVNQSYVDKVISAAARFGTAEPVPPALAEGKKT